MKVNKIEIIFKNDKLFASIYPNWNTKTQAMTPICNVSVEELEDSYKVSIEFPEPKYSRKEFICKELTFYNVELRVNSIERVQLEDLRVKISMYYFWKDKQLTDYAYINYYKAQIFSLEPIRAVVI